MSCAENATAMPNTSSIVSVRMSQSKRDLLGTAVEQTRTKLGDFIGRKAIDATELENLDRRVVTIPAKDWEKFEAWVGAPAKDIPALRELAASHAVWQD